MRYGLLLALLIACRSLAADNAADTAARIDRLKTQIAALEKQIDAELGDRESLQRQLRANDREIAEISLRKNDLDLRLATLKREAGTLTQQRDRLQAEVDRASRTLLELLREEYRHSRQPRLRLLLTDQNPADIDRMLRYYDHLSSAMRARLTEFQAQLAALGTTNQQLDSTEEEIRQEQLALAEEQRILEAARIKRLKTLARIEASVGQKRGQLADLSADVERLHRVLEEINRSIELASLESNAQPFAKLKAKLRWPLEGRVIQRFGSDRSKDGIVIGADAGNTVYAVHAGRVVFSEWLRGYGLLIIVDHGQGYMSLYGHNQSLLRQTGDWISGGEAIAISGSSGGSDEAGLYFSIRHKARSTDPLEWLVKKG